VFARALAAATVKIRGFGAIESLCAICMLCLILAPSISIIWKTLAEVFRLESMGQVRLPFIVEWFTANNRVLHALRNTLVVSAAVSVPCTAAAVISGLTWWDAREFKRMIVLGFCLAAIPGEAYAIGIFMTLRVCHLVVAPLAMVAISEIAWTFPFCLMTVATGFAAIRQSELLGAADCGASKWDTLKEIVVHSCWPEILMSFVVGGILAFNEVSRVFFLAGSQELLSEYVASRLHSGSDISDYVLASCGTILGFLVVIGFLAVWLYSTSRKLEAAQKRATGSTRLALLEQGI